MWIFKGRQILQAKAEDVQEPMMHKYLEIPCKIHSHFLYLLAFHIFFMYLF